MKTTFKNLFNEWNDDLLDIPESTVCEHTDISSYTVKNSVLSQLGLHKKKKPFGKAFKLTVIAAALATALIVGTTAINANGGVQLVFEEFFGGNMNSMGLYSGSDITFTSSDPNLNVELLGLTGDEYSVHVMLEATKKDGSAFTEDGYINPVTFWNEQERNEVISSPPNDPFEFENRMLGTYGMEIYCKDRDTGDSGRRENTNPHYYLNENRTVMKILVTVDNRKRDLRDGIMTIKSTKFTARKILELLASYPQASAESFEAYQNIIKERNLDEKDTTFLLYGDDSVDYCIADSKDFDLPFEMSFKLNYRNNGNIKKTLTNADAPHLIPKVTHDVQMTITANGIYITGQTEPGKTRGNCFWQFDSDNSKIVMKDGTEYRFVGWGSGASGGPATGILNETQRLTYQIDVTNKYIPSYNKFIDVRKVKEVIINGDTVYQN